MMLSKVDKAYFSTPTLSCIFRDMANKFGNTEPCVLFVMKIQISNKICQSLINCIITAEI